MISINNVSVAYQNKSVLDGLSFIFEDGRKYAIMGESGCGKTTLLNTIAGLIKPNKGNIISDKQKIAYVFQDPRLFPWLTVMQNITLVSSLPPKEAQEKAMDILRNLGLEDSADKYPEELSGGMKQRVSIARALVYDYDILLLDEPFRALDEDTAQKTAKYIFTDAKEKTVIFVTHDKNDIKYADCLLLTNSSPISRFDMVKSDTPTTE